MHRLGVLRLIGGWLWATGLLVAGLFLLDRGLPVGLAVASIAAALGIFWTLVADHLCPGRSVWLGRGLELVAAGAVVVGGGWGLWLVSTP